MPNRLINEQSHYLLQHAHNPVDWYPWGDEAFEKARAENKPVIVSIGYAACHWCHVMERESFEDETTAAFMNENFVCIKVDREEHPDVDHLYMDAVQAISGNGGWPLNAFVTPGRVPFYGGTYYPPRPAYSRPSWTQLMERMLDIWHNRHDEVTQQSEQMVKYLKQAARGLSAKPVQDLDMDVCRNIATGIMRLADKQKGGFGNAPKFPGTMAISFLLEHYHFTGDKDCLQQALLSLDAMADGGIYDQLGGGFARYSTDREWLAPHFEKMLYDNALLIGTYCDAFAVTGNPRYQQIVAETIAFTERELKHASGGYFCALDADSEGVEGKFYTWLWHEFAAVTGEDAPIVAAHFGVTEHGNWEETNILHIAKSIGDIAIETGLPEAVITEKIDKAKGLLFKARAEKIRPLTDDKCLLSWNALLNIALTKAAATFGNEAYQHLAESQMQWMVHSFESAEGLKHTWKDGVARIPAKLDDFAYLIQAMLQLASLTGEDQWIMKATGLVEEVIAEFAHEELYFYFTPAKQTDIPVRKLDLYDGATPSANAIMANNLWICGMCSERPEWIELSKMMVGNMVDNALRNGYSFGNWAQLIQRNAAGIKSVVCTGENAQKAAGIMKKQFLPQLFLLFSTKNEGFAPILKNKFSLNNLSIFVCSENACSAAVSTVDQALRVVENIQ